MKKLLVVLLSAAMVLTMAAVSMAAITVNGQLDLKYDFGTGDSKTDTRVWFTGKVNDEVTAYLRLRGNNAQLDSEYYYVNIAKEFAGFQIGRWEFATDGNVDILDALNYLRAESKDWAVLTTLPFGDACKGYVWYEPTDAGGSYNNYAVGFGYTGGNWGVDAFYINDDTDNDDTGYAVNLYIAPVDAFKAYLHFAQSDEVLTFDNDQAQYTILGFTYKVAKVLVRGEYDLNDEKGGEFNPWGIALSYFSNNGIEWKFQRYDNYSKTATEYKSETCEVRAIVKF